MRLKKIRLAGFKSFVDPTNIPFPGDMTAVVGPNGCGKSNVIDAVRWVLGESSAKNLRGDAMTDVIFNGSSARKPVSQCSVELLFDNSEGRIGGEYANYSELSVKRVVTKDAISSYLLNGVKCRRRDITDLFLGTGLGPRSYAIIEQGMISKLIESKPQELRVFIEEAAGISKYKERRKETLNRIGHTKDNLLRLDDVRQELADQLSKLKRQASAANRYKELKAQERDLKGQLTTIRWLMQTKLLKETDERIAAEQEALDSLMSGKAGDESGLQALKNDQSVVKQELNDLQQQVYKLGNDITTLEQSQLFAKKRGNQIQSELQQIDQQKQQLSTQLFTIEDEMATLEQKILQNQPETQILEEQLEELEHTLDEYQQSSNDADAELKNIEDKFYEQKQVVQQKHSQLQQTLSLQQRSEARISELESELSEYAELDQSVVQDLQEQLEQLAQEQMEIEVQLRSAIENLQLETDTLALHTEAFSSSDTRCIELHAQIKALQSLQNVDEVSKPSYVSEENAKPSWQEFTAQSGYERALETALASYKEALVVSELNMEQIYQAQEHGHQALFLSEFFTQEKRQKSLAYVVEQNDVPHYFNAVMIAHNRAEVAKLLPELGLGEIVVTIDGEVFSKDVFVSNEKQTEGKISRSATIKTLEQEFEQTSERRNEYQDLRDDAQKRVSHASSEKQSCESALSKNKSEQALISRDIENLSTQLEQQKNKQQRILQDIEKYKETLAQEQMSSEMLVEEIEDASIELAQIEAQKLDASSDKQGAAVQVQAMQTQLQHVKQRMHEQALTNQSLQNSYQILGEKQKNAQSQLSDNEEKALLLRDEAETLLLPSEEQEQKLGDMLEHKEQLGQQQEQKQKALEEIDEQIATIEKGQVGLNQQIDSIKQRIESERLSGQTHRVKAQSFIEQLGQMKLSVKEVLEDLPEDAEEKAYEQSLDSTQSSLSRLGAVNLAAVDEYEEQAQRKQKLDEQNDDLSQALDTLESAMRKIDKETRSRFKHTFDQVNADLKMLFPKVFGGGSAYLALTEDDLLDTGITIMARPPGKKNSTIHLLSGGEKALTALSLVFAIFRLNPAPFCLLDEVDAPLDDANVGRFCKLVSEMSKTVQFIYITHNKVAMEMATHLTGVTMAEPGVSRMVSVDMEEALAIAE
jgi:chromosome segregation protein